MKIARAELSAICRAVGVLAPKDSVELHNLPLVIHVRCKKRTDTSEITNEIKGYAKKDQPPTAAAGDSCVFACSSAVTADMSSRPAIRPGRLLRR